MTDPATRYERLRDAVHGLLDQITAYDENVLPHMNLNDLEAALAPDAPPSKRILMVCGHCGSTEVSSDATARWSPEIGDWEMTGLHDNSDCDHCGGECNVEEIEDTGEPRCEDCGRLMSTHCTLPGHGCTSVDDAGEDCCDKCTEGERLKQRCSGCRELRTFEEQTTWQQWACGACGYWNARPQDEIDADHNRLVKGGAA